MGQRGSDLAVIEIEQLRYVRLCTRNLPVAIDFAQRILGLQLIEKSDEQATFRSDFRDHTLVYEVGDPSQQSVGLEVRTQAVLDHAVAVLAANGITAMAGNANALARRKARAMASFRDRSGNTFELTAGDLGLALLSLPRCRRHRPYGCCAAHHGERGGRDALDHAVQRAGQRLGGRCGLYSFRRCPSSAGVASLQSRWRARG